jgi:hypothetical protein
MAAGARSIFFTTSLSNPRIAQQIPKAVLKMHGLDNTTVKSLGKKIDSDHSLFFRLMADAAADQGKCRPWNASLLLVSVEGLSRLIANFRESIEAKALLLAVLSEFFQQSCNTRSDYFRQMVVSDRLSSRQISGYAARTVHHLIEIMRGEFPGFVPHNPTMGDDFGPFNAVYEYLQEHDLISARFTDSFPLFCDLPI